MINSPGLSFIMFTKEKRWIVWFFTVNSGERIAIIYHFFIEDFNLILIYIYKKLKAKNSILECQSN